MTKAHAEGDASEGQDVGSKSSPVQALLTRHVFLDTEVYKALGYSTTNRAMVLLRDAVASHHVVLHTADITLLEVQRQIRELVLTTGRELGKLERQLSHWRNAAPKAAPSAPVTFDAETLASQLFQTFQSFICTRCDATMHAALKVDPSIVFDDYFARKPPFDREGSKEFPDAFVLAALTEWCISRGEQIYIVTADKAVQRAVSESTQLLSLKDIHELLARAAADLSEDGEKASEEVFEQPSFDYTFEEVLSRQVSLQEFVYAGDLVEGEAFEGELVQIEEVSDVSVVGLSERRITLILDVLMTVRVEVQYEDREGAFYDREDRRWYMTETASTQVEEEVRIEVVIDVERQSRKVLEGKILNRDIPIYGSGDW